MGSIVILSFFIAPLLRMRASRRHMVLSFYVASMPERIPIAEKMLPLLEPTAAALLQELGAIPFAWHAR